MTTECNCQTPGSVPTITLFDKTGAVLDYVRQDCPMHGLKADDDGVLSWTWRRVGQAPEQGA